MMDEEVEAKAARPISSPSSSSSSFFPPGYSQVDFYGINDEAFAAKLLQIYSNYKNNSIVRYSDCIDSSSCCFQDKIPQVLHFIWLGSSLQEHHNMIIATWVRYHPDWKVCVWTDEDVPTVLVNPCLMDLFVRSPNYGMKSDILRYSILERSGGVYVDLDYECFNSLDNICKSVGFFAGVSNTTAFEINNGIIGCCAHHPAITALSKNLICNAQEFESRRLHLSSINCILQFLDPSELTSAINALSGATALDTVKLTGPGLITATLYNYLVVEDKSGVDKEIVIFPFTVFHPVPNNVRVDICDEAVRNNFKELHKCQDTICIHWWQRSWQ